MGGYIPPKPRSFTKRLEKRKQKQKKTKNNLVKSIVLAQFLELDGEICVGYSYSVVLQHSVARERSDKITSIRVWRATLKSKRKKSKKKKYQ